MNIIIAGADGRMGRALAAAAGEAKSPEIKLAGLIESAGHKSLGEMSYGVRITDDLEQALSDAGERCGLIDFTSAGGPAELARAAAHHNAVYVVGTTALSDEDKKQLSAAAKKIPVIASENMSFGIAMMASFCAPGGGSVIASGLGH